MKLTVENFGPIRKAKVDIRPMTVFVGPSNTGKSYLAILIYSIVKALGDEAKPWFFYQKIDRDLKKSETLKEIVYEIDEEIAGDWERLSQEIQEHGNLIVDELFLSWTEVTADILKDQIVYCFGEEGKKIIESSEDLVIKITGPGNALTLNLSPLDKGKLNDEKKKKMTDLLTEYVPALIQEFQDEDELGLYDPEDAIYAILARSCTRIIYRKFNSLLFADERPFARSHYLPAIRGGVMQSHRTLVSALIKRAPMAGLSDKFPSIPLFTGVLADFMTKLVNIGSDADRIEAQRITRLQRISRGRESSVQAIQEIKKVGSGIENRIMGGAIAVQSSETDYPDFRYTFRKGEQEHNLPLMNASSSVSELAPIVLFIRYYLSPGDIFIVEEPEAHLHPAAQRIVAGVLVELVKAGVYVIATTHSDIILEQISNFVYANEIPEAKVLGEKAEKRTLPKHDIGAYMFPGSKTGKGTNVKKIAFDEETGILTADHLDVSSDLYNETVDLFNTRERTNDV